MKQKLAKILQRITLKAHQGQIGQNHYILEEINEKLRQVEEKQRLIREAGGKTTPEIETAFRPKTFAAMPHGLNHTPDDPRFIMIVKEFIKQDIEQEISSSKKLTVQEKREKLQQLQEKIRL